MELLNERWAPVLGYEGRYEVSDHGRVRSLERWRRGKLGCLVPVPARMMRLQTKKFKNNRTLPYIEVKLRDGSPRETPCKSFLVHRLVAQVDHKDGEHGNNHWTNLRVLSAREHALLHPCIATAEGRKVLQAAAQAKVRALRETGELVGRLRVTRTGAVT